MAQEPLFDLPETDALSDFRHPRARKGGTVFRSPVESSLFPETLGARFKPDDPVRVLLRDLESMDLTPVLRSYDHRGGTPYHPLNLLAVVLFGMSKGVRSSRALEEACRYDVRFMYLMGGQEPDDRTFGRFLERMDGVIVEAFNRIMRSKKPKGHLALVDGRKVAASASWWKFREDGEITDPEARIQKSHGRYIIGYNAQVMMDEATGLIMAAELLPDQDDSYAMEPVLQAMERQSPIAPVAVVADSGYDCEDSVVALESRGIDSVIAFQRPPPGSVHENEDGQLVCPIGRVLQPRGKPQDIKGVSYIDYRPGCRGCPLAATCAFKGKTLRVQVDSDPGFRFRNRERLNSSTYDGALKKRRKVERVFAQMVHDGFGGFLRRGQKKAFTEFLLWVISYNQRVVFKLLWALLEATQERLRNFVAIIASLAMPKLAPVTH
jgi:transposase